MACFIIAGESALRVKRGSVALIEGVQSSVAEGERDGLPKLTVCTRQKSIATFSQHF